MPEGLSPVRHGVVVEGVALPAHLSWSSTKSILVPRTCMRAAGSIKIRTPFSSTSSSNLPFVSAW